MGIIAVETVILITTSAWLGLYLYTCHYKGTAGWLTGIAYSCYALYLLLRALAWSSEDVTLGLFAARLAFIPVVIAMMALLRLSLSFRRPHGRRITRFLLQVMTVMGICLSVVAVGTPLLHERVTYDVEQGWAQLEPGLLFGVWLVYATLAIGMSVYFILGAWHRRTDQGKLYAPNARLMNRRGLVAILLAIASALASHLARVYLGTYIILPSLVMAACSLYIAYTFVTQFDRAYRNPTSAGMASAGVTTSAGVTSAGVARRILTDTGVIIVGTFVTIMAVVLVGQVRLPVQIIFIISYWVGILAALQASTRHTMYASLGHQVRRLNRQLRAARDLSPQPLLRQAQDDFRPAQNDLRPARDVLRQAQDDIRPAQNDHGERSEYSAVEPQAQDVTPIAGEGEGEKQRSAITAQHEEEQPVMIAAQREKGERQPKSVASRQEEAKRQRQGEMPAAGSVQWEGGWALPETSSLSKEDMGERAWERARERDNAQPQLLQALRLALRHLHDPAHLGTISLLADELPGETPWERGQALQQKLIEAIQRTQPPDSDLHGILWQRYQIMWRLYHEGGSRTEIMHDLSLSERHYQRHLHEGLAMLVTQWQKFGNNGVDEKDFAD